MRFEFILEQVTIMNVNFQLKKDDNELIQYCDLLQSRLTKKGFTEEMLGNAIDKFMDITEGCNFNKLPSTGDLINAIGMKPKTVEQMAQQQCDLVFSVIDRLDLQTRCIFSDKVTNYILKNYAGGFNMFIWDNSKRNEKKQELTWRKSAFIKSYTSAYDSNLESVEPLKLKHINGRYGSLLVGAEEVCKANILAHENNLLFLSNKTQNDTVCKITKIYNNG